MLHTVPELAEHNIRDIERILASEINAHSLGAN